MLSLKEDLHENLYAKYYVAYSAEERRCHLELITSSDKDQ